MKERERERDCDRCVMHSHCATTHVPVHVHMRVCVCMHMCVCACVRACAHACARQEAGKRATVDAQQHVCMMRPCPTLRSSAQAKACPAWLLGCCGSCCWSGGCRWRPCASAGESALHARMAQDVHARSACRAQELASAADHSNVTASTSCALDGARWAWIALLRPQDRDLS